MARPNKKKVIAKQTRGDKKKLPRGYKECGNCSTLLNIHKYVCDQCGHKHDMKRKKVDILKNLNNLTPKLLRSLIELNDFNDVTELVSPSPQYRPTLFLKPEAVIPQEFKRRRSSKSMSQLITQNQGINFIDGGDFVYSKMGVNLTALCGIGENVLIAQSVEKWTDFTQSEKTTVRAYGLDKYHKLGQIYAGKTNLSFINNKRLAYRISINEHILLLRSIGNKVAALTGKGTVLVLNIQTNLAEMELVNYECREALEVKVGEQDQITVMEWLKGHSTVNEAVLIVGTLMGHLYLYSISEKEIKLIRFFCNAHFQSVSALSECPLATSQETIFASGSHDGSLAVWSSNSRECLYRMEASNRKVTSLLWDPGAKFIFVIRDENQDSGVLACFFAILKSEQSVALSDQIDFRLIKCSPNCKIMYNGYNEICLLDTYSCVARVIPTEELRKNSLKRKKVKREEQDRTYILRLPLSEKIQQNSQEKMNEKYLPLPLIADACILTSNQTNELWGITYEGLLFLLQMK